MDLYVIQIMVQIATWY